MCTSLSLERWSRAMWRMVQKRSGKSAKRHRFSDDVLDHYRPIDQGTVDAHRPRGPSHKATDRNKARVYLCSSVCGLWWSGRLGGCYRRCKIHNTTTTEPNNYYF